MLEKAPWALMMPGRCVADLMKPDMPSPFDNKWDEQVVLVPLDPLI